MTTASRRHDAGLHRSWQRYGDGRKLPLAIMVSDDTEERTRVMLEQERYFGMGKGQVTLMKQEKVAALQASEPGCDSGKERGTGIRRVNREHRSRDPWF